MFCGGLKILRIFDKLKRNVPEIYVQSTYSRGKIGVKSQKRAVRPPTDPPPTLTVTLKFSGNENQFYCGVVVLLCVCSFLFVMAACSLSLHAPHSLPTHFIIFLLGNKGTKCAKQSFVTNEPSVFWWSIIFRPRNHLQENSFNFAKNIKRCEGFDKLNENVLICNSVMTYEPLSHENLHFRINYV